MCSWQQCKSLLKRFIEELEQPRVGPGLVPLLKPVLYCRSLKVGLENSKNVPIIKSRT